jgi:hypothetical protein
VTPAATGPDGEQTIRPYRRDDADDEAQALVAAAVTALNEAAQDGNPSAVNRAVDLFERAVAATPPYHRLRPSRLANLGGALGVRSDLTGSDADLERADELVTEGLAALPAGHSDRCSYLYLHGAQLEPPISTQQQCG